ncbi:MAG: chemoreceptor glutamine deamidase CheD [Rubrivivax sp.]|nr:chemoreceptor glutamine deamidase CheD [Rubrivivax sp.]
MSPPLAAAPEQENTVGMTPRLAALRASPRRPGEASFFFWDAHFQTESVKVLPGEFYVDASPILITTTLGSCIAACLWDRDRRIGGLNHFMLPDGPAAGAAGGGRYGAYAMDQLIGELIKRGAQRGSLEAKIFGGGSVIDGMNTIQIGERNTQFVTEYLHTERIPIVSKDVLDVYPRKVAFLPHTGKALVKRLQPRANEAVVAQEQLARQRAASTAQATGGSVDLF